MWKWTHRFLPHWSLFPLDLCRSVLEIPLRIINIVSRPVWWNKLDVIILASSAHKHTYIYTPMNIITDVFNNSAFIKLDFPVPVCVCTMFLPFFHIHSSCVFLKAAQTVRAMLKVAKNAVPRLDWKRTPVLLRATAGLRLLPAGKAQALLDQVKHHNSKDLIFHWEPWELLDEACLALSKAKRVLTPRWGHFQICSGRQCAVSLVWKGLVEGIRS